LEDATYFTVAKIVVQSWYLYYSCNWSVNQQECHMKANVVGMMVVFRLILVGTANSGGITEVLPEVVVKGKKTLTFCQLSSPTKELKAPVISALTINREFDKLHALVKATEMSRRDEFLEQVYASASARIAEFYFKESVAITVRREYMFFPCKDIPMNTPGNWFLIDGQTPGKQDSYNGWLRRECLSALLSGGNPALYAHPYEGVMNSIMLEGVPGNGIISWSLEF
jgi:hypothetical protein